MSESNQNKRKRNKLEVAPVNPVVLKKYHHGEGVNVKAIKGQFHKIKVKQKENKIKYAEEETARAEILLPEDHGFLEGEDGLRTSHISQNEIKASVNIATASKSFKLILNDFGPYRFCYARNGRYMCLGGRKGHLATFDWITKKLNFEVNVMESIHDVCWMNETEMLAVAQKNYVYIYDNKGTEIHCIQKMQKVSRLDYLPYHFLLCSGHDYGLLSWLDISMGKSIVSVHTHQGKIENMCQNPYNGVLCCGHPKGIVTMWTPNCQDPVAKVLCHAHPVQALTIDPYGRYMATASIDRTMKVWDLRNLGTELRSFKINHAASHLALSQRGLLAASIGNIVEVYKDVVRGSFSEAYMRSIETSAVTCLQFCPFEDILGVASYKGFSSLIIPGSGEPNYDALEVNPYSGKSGQREAEIKSLLNKIPMDQITLDPFSISQVDTLTLEEKLEAKLKLKYIKVPKIDLKPRNRMRGKSGSAQKFKRKEQMRSNFKMAYLKEAQKQKKQIFKKKEDKKSDETNDFLSRFKSKIKVKQ